MSTEASGPAYGQAPEPNLYLTLGDVPGALKVVQFLVDTYNYTAIDTREPSDFERTLLAMAKDIQDAVEQVTL